MKKWFSLALLGTAIALLSLAYGARPASAASRHVTARHTPAAVMLRTTPSRWHPRGWQSHDQYYHGDAFSHNRLTFRGHNQNNSGNQGHNRGYNQNYGGNAGNELLNRHLSHAHLHTRQFFSGNSYSHNYVTSIGYNQYNSGNQGYNEGVNEDHGSNGGNQIVN
jgi:hypothetical protein